MQQALFALERQVPEMVQVSLKNHSQDAGPATPSALGLWQQGKRDEVLEMIEPWINDDASLLYVYAGLKGLWMAEQTLGEALSYLRVAAEMKTDDPSLQPVLEEARQNLVTFNASLLDVVTTLAIPAVIWRRLYRLGGHTTQT
jgi:hypothetical protein